MVLRYQVSGHWLRRWRNTRKMSLAAVCQRLNQLGYAWYPMKLCRLENKPKAELDAKELSALAAALSLTCEDLLVQHK